ncbi:MAG: disulfide bond formation protein B [Gammaproteobacteria bacterium]|nr:disulfide bond formation protein B [Gammaproteobacteria bacterium]
MFAEWDRKDLWNLGAVAWAAAMVGVALVLELGFAQEPCPLCINQRWWAVLAGILAVAGFAHNPRLGIYPLLVSLASLAGAAFAIRHLYIMTLPPGTVKGCGVPLDYVLDVFPVGDILRVMAGTGECADQSFVITARAVAGFWGYLALTVNYWRSR